VNQASSLKLGNVVRCRGCLNGYHLGCLGPEGEKPAGAEEKWRCPHCLAGIHPCFLCKLSEGETVPASPSQGCICVASGINLYKYGLKFTTGDSKKRLAT